MSDSSIATEGSKNGKWFLPVECEDMYDQRQRNNITENVNIRSSMALILDTYAPSGGGEKPRHRRCEIQGFHFWRKINIIKTIKELK
jgi:hypothetical protein